MKKFCVDNSSNPLFMNKNKTVDVNDEVKCVLSDIKYLLYTFLTMKEIKEDVFYDFHITQFT